MLLALLDPGTAVAGVFTRSKCPSAPVDWCRDRLRNGSTARALVVNSGNANAFTGKSGRAATKLTAEVAAKAAGCKPADVFLASTGVIGEPLEAAQIRRRSWSASSPDAAPGGWHEAAKAIMTTDTFPKGAAAMVRLGSSVVTICGIAKGAGMIAPDMGDDAVVRVHRRADRARGAAERCCKRGVEDTFNAVTIDGDTSTSDTLLAFATGAAATRGVAAIARLSDPRLAAFRKGFDAVLADLAEQVARDGEGARKLVEIIVEGAVSKTFGAPHRHVDRQFAAGQDRDRRRGRQLGPRGHGGRQGRRAGRPRPAGDLVRRHPRRAQGRARSGLRRGRGLGRDEEAGDHR